MKQHEQPSLLLFEPESKGHHLQYLQYLTEDFLAGGFRLSVAYDQKTDSARQRMEQAHPGLMAQTSQFNSYGSKKNYLKTAFQCLEKSGAEELFLCCIDEVSSALFRKAALGLRPPEGLKGKMSGIFIRPRPLDPKEPLSHNLKLKRTGLNRLLQEGWFKNIFLLDEFLTEYLKKQELGAAFHFLPDVADAAPRTLSKEAARKQLNLPKDKNILLHYGTGTRRKGLPLVLEALKKTPDPSRFYLIVAGRQEESSKALENMVKKNRAMLIDRFISEAESDALFAASDWILLPYIDHYGASNVLARAAQAKRPVIASNYHLLGKRVENYKIGICFQNNNAVDLQRKLIESLKADRKDFESGLINYSRKFTRTTFREHLLIPYQSPVYTAAQTAWHT